MSPFLSLKEMAFGMPFSLTQAWHDARMAFGLTQAVSQLEQRSTATVKYVFIALCRNFHLTVSASPDNMNRVVVVSTFYETKRTAGEQVSFAKNDQQVN